MKQKFKNSKFKLKMVVKINTKEREVAFIRNLGQLSTKSNDVVQDRPTSLASSPHLRRSIGAALWRLADRRIGIFQPVFDARSSVHFHVGDGENALAVGAWNFAFIPVLINSTN